MAMVFVLIISELGTEERVLAALQALESVTETHIVYGVYEIIAKAKAPSMDAIKSVFLKQIRNIPDMRSKLTMVVEENSL